MKKKIRLLLSAALLSCFLSPLSFAADDTSSGTGSSSSDTSVTLPSSYTKDSVTYSLSGFNGLVGIYKSDSSSPSADYLVITYQSDGKTVDSVVSHPVTDNYSVLPSSVISGGTGNVITGNNSVISGGYSNEVISDNSVISGGNKNVIHDGISSDGSVISSNNSTIIGSENSVSTSSHATLVGGNTFSAPTGSYSTLVGGSNNSVQTNYGTVIGGSFNSTVNSSGNLVTPASYATVVGGMRNFTYGSYGTIVGGNQNWSSSDYSVVLGGVGNSVEVTTGSDNYSLISGGSGNIIMDGDYSLISGGASNRINHGKEHTNVYMSVFGGNNNGVEDSSFSSVFGGYSNNIFGSGNSQYNNIFGGSQNTLYYGSNSSFFNSNSSMISGSYDTILGGSAVIYPDYSLSIGGFGANAILKDSTGSIAVGGNHVIYQNAPNSFVIGNSNTVSEKADHSILIGNDNKSLVSKGMAIGNEAVASESGTIAFGHLSTDISHYDTVYDDLTDADKTSLTNALNDVYKASSTDYAGLLTALKKYHTSYTSADAIKTDIAAASSFDDWVSKTVSATKETTPKQVPVSYGSDGLSRLVKVADGKDLHDAVTVEQLNNAVTDNTYKAGDGILIADDKTISLNHMLGTDNFDLETIHKTKPNFSYTYTASGKDALVLGGQVSNSGLYSGFYDFNKASSFGAIGDYSVVIGGNSLLASGVGSVASGGITNRVTGDYSGIFGGSDNFVSGSNSYAFGSSGSIVTGDNSIVIGDGINRGVWSSIYDGGTIDGSTSTSSVWQGGSIYHSFVSLVAGSNSIIGGDQSSAFGGINNTIGAYTVEYHNRNMDNSTNIDGNTVYIPIYQINSTEDGSTSIGGIMNHMLSDCGLSAGGEWNIVTGSFAANLGGEDNVTNGATSVTIGGRGTKSLGSYSVAIGGAVTRGSFGVAIGNGAADFGSSYDGKSMALGYQAVSHEDNTISFGHQKGDPFDISFVSTPLTDESKINSLKSQLSSYLNVLTSPDEYWNTLSASGKEQTIDTAITNANELLGKNGVPDSLWFSYSKRSYTSDELSTLIDKAAAAATIISPKTETYTSDVYNRLVNVADGINDHDAATVAQVKKAITNGGINYTGGSHISVTSDAVIDTKNVLAYDSDDNDVATLVGKTGTKVANVKGGAVSASSMEAINGSQLYTTNQAISGFAKDIQKNTAALKDLSSSVTEANSSATTAITLANDLDASKADTSLSNLSDSGKSVISAAVNEGIQNYFKNKATVTTSANVTKTMLFRMPMRAPAPDTEALLEKKADISYVDKQLETKADKEDLNKKADITYVDNGLSQKADITYVDNGLSQKADKTFVEAGLKLKADKSYVDKNLAKVNAKMDLKASSDASNIDVDKFTQKLDIGAVEANNKGLVSGSKVYNAIKDKADKGYVDALALGLNQEIVGTAQGLHNEIQQMGNNLNKNINKAAAGSNALAALHPMEYDPDDKMNFAAGYGHYKGANATAIGAYYYPNANTMFSVGTTIGNGSPSVNAGISVKLGKGSAYNGVSKAQMVSAINNLSKENEAIKNENQEIKDENKAIREHDKELEERLAKLEAYVQSVKK